jgi:diguanylate cyclase (GGDEF)-like protein/PAS domain S-box-containing protein
VYGPSEITRDNSHEKNPLMRRLRKTSKPLSRKFLPRPVPDAPRPSRRSASSARRQAVEALGARALSASGLGAWAWDLATDVVACSPDLEVLWGLTPGTFGGTSEAVREAVHPDDRPAFTEAARRTLETGQDHLVLYRTLRPDGAVRWIEAKGQVVRDAAGQVCGMIGVSMDVTARVEAEEGGRAREGRLQALADNVPVLIARIDTGRRYVFANRAYEDVLGIPVAQVVGRTMAEVLGEAAYETVRPYVDRALAGEAVQYDATLHYRTVGARFVHGVYAPERGPGGEVTGFLLSAVDISARKEAEAATHRLALIVENSHEAIVSTDLEGTVLSWNRGAERLYGWTAEEIIGRSVFLTFPSDREAADVSQMLSDLEQAGRALEYEAVRVCKDGTWRNIAVTFSPVHDAEGSLMGRAFILRDVTAQREAERERAQAERQGVRLSAYIRLLLDSSGEGIFGADLAGRCTFFNQAAARMFGLSPAEAVGRSLHALIHHSRADGSPYPVEECPVLQALQEGRECRLDGEVMWRVDGTSFQTHLSCMPLFEGGVPHGAVITVADISGRKALEAEREHLLAQTEALLAEATARADRDPLTGLLNHRAFHEKLEEETERAGREGTFLAVAMLDVDGFKFFNDAYGHPVGDDALRRVADVLRHICRSYDTLARFGGDEFAVLMPGVGRGETEAVAARMARGLEGISIRPPGGAEDVPLRLSMGLSVFPDAGLSRMEAVALADKRLYRAKSGGRGSFYADLGAEPGDAASRLRGQMGGVVEGFSMLDALVTAVDARDRYTRRHSEEVLAHSLAIARALGLDEPARQTVAVAALLHDVGKIGVPDQILRKPGRLTEEELEAVKQHPLMGAVIVGAVPGLQSALDAIRHHHERWDGAGYPDGLRGEEIPPAARLLAVADAFSALTSDRPYRKGLDAAGALRLLEEGAGTQWDPACVAAFLRARSP